MRDEQGWMRDPERRRGVACLGRRCRPQRLFSALNHVLRLLSFHTRSLNVVMHSDCNPCSCPLACCKPASYYERRHFSASPTAKNSALREGPAAHPAPPLLPRSCMPFFRKLCSRLPFPRLVDAQLGVRGSCVRRGDVQTYRSPAGNLVAVQETYLEDHGT